MICLCAGYEAISVANETRACAFEMRIVAYLDNSRSATVVFIELSPRVYRFSRI